MTYTIVFLRGSVHKNQVDLPFMVPPYLRRWLGLHSTIDPHLAMDLNNRITLLYLRKHLGMIYTFEIFLQYRFSV